MKRLLAALLALLLLPLSAALAGETEDPTALLNQAFSAETAEDRLRLIERAAEADPQSARTLTSCAEVLLYFDESPERAEAFLRAALSLPEEGTRRETLETLAQLLLYGGRADEAVALTQAECAAHPEDDSLLVLHATTLYFADRAEEALAALDGLLARVPDHYEALGLRASLLMAAYRYDEAIDAYRALSDAHPELLDGLIGEYQALCAAGRFERASRTAEKILMNGGDRAFWIERARLRLWKLYQPEEALAEAEALLRSDSGWEDASLVQMGAYLMLDRFEDAAAVAAEVERADELFGRLMRGVASLDAGRFEEAEAVLRALIEDAPGHYLAMSYRAAALLGGPDDVEGAEAQLRDAFALTDAEAELYIRLGHLRRRQGDLEQAARAFRAASAMSNDDPTALYGLLSAYGDAGDEAGLRQTVAELETRYPGWYETLLARTVALDTLGDAEGALHAFEELKAKFPYPASQLWALEALLRAAVGDEGARVIYEEYREELETAADYDQYAYALVRLEDYEAAEAPLLTAKELLEKTEGAERRNAEISILCTRAEIALRQGDEAACVERLKEAAALGFAVGSLRCWAAFAPLGETETGRAFLDEFAPTGGAWNVDEMPLLP